MPLTNTLNWENSSTGIFRSGWSPFSSGSLSYGEEEDQVVVVYEDLRPGPIACSLLCCPPLIAFAPLFCPLLSFTSKAYHFRFDFNPKSHKVDLIMRSKAFACGGESCRVFSNVCYIRIQTEHRAHTLVTMDGWGSTSYSDSSIASHSVVIDYEDGSLTLPQFPQDDFCQLQAVVSSVLRLVRRSTSFIERDHVQVSASAGSSNAAEVLILAPHAIRVDIDHSHPNGSDDHGSCASTTT